MSAQITAINIAAIAPRPKCIQGPIEIGTDIIDVLAGSMYVDPLNIYREYIQNAVDSIDEAREQNVYENEAPSVTIAFDHISRSIKIRDNGVGIPAAEFVQRLTTIGASRKRGEMRRGFRGIGRLSGLGYCQQLIFRGRAHGEKKVMELRWDGKILREKVRDRDFHEGLAGVVKAAVTYTSLDSGSFPERFFEIELFKVTRLKNDLLLNEEKVRFYLSQVTPVPFHPDFSKGKEITEKLASYGLSDPIRVELNDGKGPVYRLMQDSFPLTEKVAERIHELEFVEIQGLDGDICAVGWIAHHSYSGALPKALGISGLRLRTGDIQVGDEAILSQLYPEARFSGWTIGELHVISPKILPNARRDDFEPSGHYVELHSNLLPLIRSIIKRIRDLSVQRNRLKEVHTQLAGADDMLTTINSQKMPSILLNVLKDLMQERLKKSELEVLKLPEDSAERHAAIARLQKLKDETFSITSRGTRHELGEGLHEPIAAALRTIMTSSKTHTAGMELSIKVLDAIAIA